MADMSGMGGPGQEPGSDSPASHTMLVLGTGQVFLSHLPMFMKPHHYQVILQASFSGSDPQRVYVDDRKAHPKALLYTLQPKAFVLPDLFPPSPGQPARLRSFQASLFVGLPPAVPVVDAVAGEPVPVQLRPQLEFSLNDNSDLQ